MSEEELEADFESLDGKVLVFRKISSHHYVPATHEDWTDFFSDITPNQLYSRFQNAAGEKPINITINLPKKQIARSEHSQKLNQRAQIIITQNTAELEHHTNKTQIAFHLNSDGTVQLDEFYLKSEDQSKHLAKRYLANVATLCDQMGMQNIEVNAINTGAYAWAKYGFIPMNQVQWEVLQAQVEERIDFAKGTLRYEGIKYDVSNEMPAIQKWLALPIEELEGSFGKITDLSREIGRIEGHPLTVGKALLLDTCWIGNLPLAPESPDYKRFKSYVDSAPQQTMEVGA